MIFANNKISKITSFFIKDGTLSFVGKKQTNVTNMIEPTEQDGSSKLWLERLNELVLKHISDPSLSNIFLADELMISPTKLYRKIKKITGMTPNHYIRDMRLKKANELLSSGKYLTVKEVVPLVGYVKVAYFYRIFKEHYGYPPGEVLKRKGWK